MKDSKFTISQKIEFNCDGVTQEDVVDAKILANASPKMLELLKDIVESSKKIHLHYLNKSIKNAKDYLEKIKL
jgi:hypothetical protein